MGEQILFQDEIKEFHMDHVKRDQAFNMRQNHFHDTYELYFLLEGECIYFIGKEVIYVNAGTVVLINRNNLHKTSALGNGKIDRVLFQIHDSFLEKYLGSMGLFSFPEFFSMQTVAITASEMDWNRIMVLIQQIKLQFEKKRLYWEVLVKQMLSEILIILYQYRETPMLMEGERSTLLETPKYQIVREIAEYITRYYKEDQSLEKLAKQFYISKAYLTRIFKEVTGVTINEYINITRIQIAKKMLKTTDYSITEVSAMVGYDNLSYFHRIFKRYTDMTPLKYRKTVE